MRIELQNVNTNKLHDELINAGVIPSLVESLGTTTWITVEDNQESAVMAVVAVHNPTPLPLNATDDKRIVALEGAINMLMMM